MYIGQFSGQRLEYLIHIGVVAFEVWDYTTRIIYFYIVYDMEDVGLYRGITIIFNGRTH
jgi:hypothetical protein